MPVYTLLPHSVLPALEAIPKVTETRFFWSDQGDRESTVRSWRTRMKKVFDRAGVAKGLSNAVHYAPWVRSRQAQLEADLAAAWRLDPSVADANHTYDTRGAKGRPN